MSTPTDKILFLMLAEFGTSQIPIERCTHHFGMTDLEVKRAAERQELPIPCYQFDSQKSS